MALRAFSRTIRRTTVAPLPFERKRELTLHLFTVRAGARTPPKKAGQATTLALISGGWEFSVSTPRTIKKAVCSSRVVTLER